jgi:hypothetical protein
MLAGRAKLLKMDAAGLEVEATQQGVPHRLWLLVDLLEHEVTVTALLHLDRVPGDVLGGAQDLATREIRDAHARRRHAGQLAVVQEGEIPRVGQERRDVGGHEALVLTQTDDQGRSHPCGHQAIRLGAMEEDEGVDTH